MKQHTVIGDRLCGELRSLSLVRAIVRTIMSGSTAAAIRTACEATRFHARANRQHRRFLRWGHDGATVTGFADAGVRLHGAA